MGFPVETVDGEIVTVERIAPGVLEAEDGRRFKPSIDALKMEALEAVEAVKDVAEEITESLGEVKDSVEVAADEIGDVIDILNADDEAEPQNADEPDAA